MTHTSPQLSPLNLQVAATFTADFVADALSFWLNKHQLTHQIQFAPYNQLFQQLLDPTSPFRQNQKGCNIILLRLEDWKRFIEPTQELESFYQENIQQFISAVQTAVAHSIVPYLVCICPANPDLPPAEILFLSSLEQQLIARLEAYPSVYTLTFAELTTFYPVPHYYDAYTNQLGHIPYTQHFFTALGTLLARRLYALFMPPKKVIVLDCDNTLWAGVCGEDGPAGVQIGEPFQTLQKMMVRQNELGFLLCLCSKNSEADVWAVFEQNPAMVLQKNHLVAWKINWHPKSSNLQALAQELNLGLDSFIFIDDNPVECAEVQGNCPEVQTILLPKDIQKISHLLNHIWSFDRLRHTAEDAQRTALYQQEVARQQFQQEAGHLADFLAGLQLKITIAPLEEATLERSAQLTQRTNQFNATTWRLSPAELTHFCAKPHHFGYTVYVQDRFGDYGLVGLILFTIENEALLVKNFLMSCRTLGRGVEQKMLAHLTNFAQENGRQKVLIPYLPTTKNQPILNFLQETGRPEETDNGQLFVFPAVDPLFASTH